MPEFLRTHPVTKSRIADSYNQAMKYPDEKPSLRLNYQLMRSRVRAITAIDSSEELKRFEILAKSSVHEIEIAGKYGMVLVYTQKNQNIKALTILRELIKKYPLNINFRIAEAEIYEGSEELERSQRILEQALDTSPGNYPLTVKYAEILLAAGNPKLAIEKLQPLSVTRPSDLFVWYLLAESYGLARDIPALHEARARFFSLKGNFEQAIKQLSYALPLVTNDFQASARIRQNIKNIIKLKNPSQNL